MVEVFWVVLVGDACDGDVLVHEERVCFVLFGLARRGGAHVAYGVGDLDGLVECCY